MWARWRILRARSGQRAAALPCQPGRRSDGAAPADQPLRASPASAPHRGRDRPLRTRPALSDAGGHVSRLLAVVARWIDNRWVAVPRPKEPFPCAVRACVRRPCCCRSATGHGAGRQRCRWPASLAEAPHGAGRQAADAPTGAAPPTERALASDRRSACARCATARPWLTAAPRRRSARWKCASRRLPGADSGHSLVHLARQRRAPPDAGAPVVHWPTSTASPACPTAPCSATA